MNALWPQTRRARGAARLMAREWDLLVIGGGITGAGILLEAARRGLRALLVEQRDFAWGTSSRSSKLVHGGLRYLKQGHLHLTARIGARARKPAARRARPGRAAGLRLRPLRAAQRGGRSILAGLALYDLLAGRRERHWLASRRLPALAPNVAPNMANAAWRAASSTPTPRPTMRAWCCACCSEAMDHGAAALNYVAARSLLREWRPGRRRRAARRGSDGSTHEVRARVVGRRHRRLVRRPAWQGRRACARCAAAT
jgi:glycerol-3-phosphate dehydrogenase